MIYQLQCKICKVVLKNQYPCFIVVQCKYDKYTEKYRTDVVMAGNRPSFKNHIFKFQKAIQDYQQIKFALMSVKDNQSLQQASIKGRASIQVTKQRLKQMDEDGQYKIIGLVLKGQEVAKLQLRITMFTSYKQEQNSSNIIHFKPYISRILYDQNCEDSIKIDKCRHNLQKQLDQQYKQFDQTKKQELSLEQIYSQLDVDQQELKDEIHTFQRLNSRITQKITQKQNKDAIELQIQLLQYTNEGKQLLIEKIAYLETRIAQEKQQHISAMTQYKQMQPAIQHKIRQAQQYSQQLKGKAAQQFEIQRNNQILTSYEDIQYQYNCNEKLIQMLSKMSEESQYTAKQAKLLLSQVKYEVQMQKYQSSSNNQQKDQILKQIEKEMQAQQHTQQQHPYKEKQEQKDKLRKIEQQIQQMQHQISKVTNKYKSELI